MFRKGRGVTLRSFRGKGRSDLSRRSRHPFLRRQGRTGQGAQLPTGYQQSNFGAEEPHPSGGQPPTTHPSAGGSKWFRSFIATKAREIAQHSTAPESGNTNDWRNRFKDWNDIGNKYRTVTDSLQTMGGAFMRKKLAPLPPDELEHFRKHGFEFGKMLGVGGYGSVWLVTMTKHYDDGTPLPVPKLVACKIMNLLTFGQKAQVSLSEAVRKLSAEAKIHYKLVHRNIVKCEHVINVPDKDTGFPYIRRLAFMELCQGDLRHLIHDKRFKRFTESEALDMFKDVSAGLKYLHDRNICHFDIKTNNVMYVREGGGRICYKLADFGLSKQFDPRYKYYTQYLGTPAYMAPEINEARLSGNPYNPMATDIYSLGLVLAETLLGSQYWSDFIHELHDGLRPEMDIINENGLPPLCGQLIASMTSLKADQRPTIDEVLNHPWLTSN